MKDFSEAEDFCRETFAGDIPGELRERLVARMAHTRRMTRLANATKVAAMAAMILFVAVALNRTGRKPASIAVTQASRGAAPNLSGWKVKSVQFSGIVRTIPLDEQLLVRSTPTTLAIVHSDGPRGYEEISDDQMFRLLEGWTIALVRVNGVAELEILTQ
jgi:hypothetical protein